MTLPTSGTITLLEIQTEFGAPTGTGLLSFYRGGTYVPNTTANSGVPTSGTISVTDFYGASAASLSATASPSSCSVSSSVAGTHTTGTTTVTATGGTGYTYAWTITGNYTDSGSGTPNIVANSPTSATTSFSGTINALNSGQNAVAVCTVHDSGGAHTTVNVGVTLTWI